MWKGHSSSSAAHRSTHLMAHMFTCIKNKPVTSALCRRNQRESTGAKQLGQMNQHKMLRLRPIRLPARARVISFLTSTFHLDRHAHPGMDAALKKMFTFLQTRDVDMAGLKDSSLRHLGEGVRLAALIDYAKSGSFFDLDRVRFEVPARVRSSIACLLK